MLIAGVAATALGVGAARAEIKVNRHGMNMAPPEQSYDVTLIRGIKVQRTRPLALERPPAPVSPTRPSAAAVPMKRLLHPELVTSAAARIGDRYDAVLQRLATEHLPRIVRSSKRYGVPADFIMAVIAVESGGRRDALSPKGAQGLMQLMPATASDLNVDDAFDPTQNIDGGTRLLSRLLERYEGDPVLTLAAYNAGEPAVTKHNGIPPYEETRDYIPRVLGAMAAARRTVSSTESEGVTPASPPPQAGRLASLAGDQG